MFYIFSSLFFYDSADHRDLHSFPTRRSSDLTARVTSGESKMSLRPRTIPAFRSLSSRNVGSKSPHTPAGTWSTDRKSTRLNSSHTVISYAVFCLKKKKNK